MVGTAMWDIMLEYRHAVVHDLQLRVLSASLSSFLQIESPFLRQMEQSVDLLEIKAHWNKPEVKVKGGQIELSAEISGGLRQVTSGRILTLDGPVSVEQNPTLAIDTQGRPYTCVDSPSLQTLNMRELKVTYEGSKRSPLLAKLDPAKAERFLRPVITTQLFGQLASIPLTYMPSSLPVAMPTSWRTATKTLRIVRALPRALEQPGSVALGLMLDKSHVSSSTLVSLLPQDSEYNAAIGISTAGLNTLLAHLCEQGKATGQFHHSQLGQTSWQWETLTVTLLNQTILIEGVLLQQGARTWVQAKIECWLDDNGIVQCRLLSGNTDALVTETLLVSWIGLLKALLSAPTAGKRNIDSGELLTQLFEIPTTTLRAEAAAQELLVKNGQLIVYYTIPKSRMRFPMALPPPKPSVTIVQPDIPRQAYEGAPITTKMEVRITETALAPYDYVWTTDLSPEPIPKYGSKLTIHAVPPAVSMSGQQMFTTVHLRVIDVFGRVSEVQAPVQYIASIQQRTLVNRMRRSLVVLAGGAVALLAGGGATAAFARMFDATHSSCPPSQTNCNGTCVNLQNDYRHCRSCGHVCPSGKTCMNGTCCSYGQTNCSGTCANLQNDYHHCGSCNNVCPPDKVCADRHCQQHCSLGQTNCSGTCADLKNDSNNCGKCGNACELDQTCVNGICQCPSGQTLCNGACVDTNTAPNNCGSCGHVCPPDKFCVNGTCQCLPDQTLCNGACVSTNADPNNCGSCGSVCLSGQFCVNGTCQQHCPPNQTACNGRCCPPGQTCSSGLCICLDGRMPCLGTCCASGYACLNGNCCLSGQVCNGVCCASGYACLSGNCCLSVQVCNGICCPSGASCVNGICCPTGQVCGSACCAVGDSCVGGVCCPAGQVCGTTCCATGTTCVGGICCPTGQISCSGVCVNTSSDPNNCGGCGILCLSGQTCVNGVCI